MSGTVTAARAGGLATILLWLGALAAVGGVAYDLNGMTQAHATVKVQVAVRPPAASAAGWGNTAVELPGVEVPDGWLAGAHPGSPIGVGTFGGNDGTLTLATWGSTRLEQGLARGGSVVGGLGLLAVALLLRPVLTGIARGEPFAPGTARALGLASNAVLIAGLLAPFPAGLASELVLDRTGLSDALAPVYAADLLPALVAVVLGVLAYAFRRGEQLTRDTEGLV